MHVAILRDGASRRLRMRGFRASPRGGLTSEVIVRRIKT
jgi:hypothetical protein